MAERATAEGARRGTRLNRDSWIDAAMDALAEGGVDAVRVEALAKRLRVSKGGFYWHFKDRPDLLDAVLQEWRDGRLAVIAGHTARDDGRDPKAVLNELLGRYAGARNRKGRAIELAVRDWARRDSAAAAVVAQVDDFRLERVASLFRDRGDGAEQAFARAYLFYAYVFGQSLLVPTPGDRRHAAAQADCARLLVGGS